MLNYSDRFQDISAENSFFAGANTPRGFVGDYSELVSEDTFDKIYLIKGGAGTGKSTLMRRCGQACAEKGACITYIKCSSDPDSLDGVIIEKEKRKIAVLDATAPHVKDCRYPGAWSELVDCGEFWNSLYLEKQRESVIERTKRKSAFYERAYKYLKAAGEIFDIQQKKGRTVLMRDKMEKAVKRICDPIKETGENGKVNYRRTQCISMKGAYRLTTFENEAQLYGIKDYSFLAPLFFEILKDELLQRGFSIEVSVSPLFGICEIRVVNAGVSFVPYREEKEFCRCINLSRFADAKNAAKVKQKRIFSTNCLSAMLDGALESLSEAGKEHFKLEGIYKEAMDFYALEKYTDDLIRKITDRI